MKVNKMIITLLFAVSLLPASAQTYYLGDGGQGIRLGVVLPVGQSFSDNDKWMLSYIQGVLTDNFTKFSGMTIIDKQNIDFTAPIRSKPRKTYDEPATSASSEGGGGHIPYLLRRLFNENCVSLRKSLNNFGKKSGLFYDIEIKEYGTDFDDAPFRLNFLSDKLPINIVNLG